MNVLDTIKDSQQGKSSFLASVYALRLLLDVLYVTYIIPAWPNKGFSIELNQFDYLESWVIFVLISLFLPDKLNRPSDFFILVLGLCLMLPMTSIHGLAAQPGWVIYNVTLGFFVIVMTRSGRLLEFPVWSRGNQIVSPLCIFSLCVVLAGIVYQGGLEYLNFNIKEVYAYREKVNTGINTGLFAYLISWVCKVLNIFLIAYALSKKQWCFALLYIGSQVFLFGLIAQKSILVFPLIVLAIWLGFRNNRKMIIVPLGLLNLILATAVIWKLSADKYSYPISLVVRRFFYVSANNIYDYLIYFSERPHVFWSNSITKKWIDYPYAQNYPYLVGDYQAALLEGSWMEESINRGVYVNSSFFATGYMQAGIAGLLFYCLIVGGVFKCVDSLSARGVSLWFTLAVTSIPMTSLILSADLPTALLTHGIIISMLLLFLIRKTPIEPNAKSLT